MSKTVWINGTERLIKNKERYGMYNIFLDDKDIKWLNNLKPQSSGKSQEDKPIKQLNEEYLEKRNTKKSDNNSYKKDCYNYGCSAKENNKCRLICEDGNCPYRKSSPS
jgi:hypothetical protein